jgi:hypothetical protein
MRQSGGTFLLAAFSPQVPEAPLASVILVLGAAAAVSVRRVRRRLIPSNT